MIWQRPAAGGGQQASDIAPDDGQRIDAEHGGSFLVKAENASTFVTDEQRDRSRIQSHKAGMGGKGRGRKGKDMFNHDSPP